MTDLLDPKNDYVFKRLFGEHPPLLVSLINDLRPDLPAILAVDILNPGINAEELYGKYIILDLLARDEAGNDYNIEIQVRHYGHWHQRALYYLARMLSQQLGQGEDYGLLRAAVGIHLLDFDLFTATAEQRQQAHWRFEMRDQAQPAVGLGNLLQLNLIELKKADRLSRDQDVRAAWITFFEHWREETTMAAIDHPPIREALSRIRQLSADEEARRLAFVRERALHDEATLLKEARQEGLERGLEQGRRETARGLLEQTTLDDATIAAITQLPLAEIEALRGRSSR